MPPVIGHSSVRDFLYMDPDTGMTLCMVADEGGFRQATAEDELRGFGAAFGRAYGDAMPTSAFDGVSSEEASLDDFVGRFERAYGAPGMA